MLKFLLILILIIYVLAKVGGYLFKMFYIGASGAQRRSAYPHDKKRAPNSNLDYEFRQKSSDKSNKGFSGGEYIDYEEVEK